MPKLIDPTITTEDPTKIKIIYNVQWSECCDGFFVHCNSPLAVCTCTPCFEYFCVSSQRNYYFILENSLESNYAINSCCFSFDNVSKYYYDRGVFDRQACCFRIGCLKGDTTFHPNNVKHMCCCVPCGDTMDSCLNCYCTSCYGDRVRMVPFEYYCCCCPTRANCCHNYCGLCGPMNGEPLLLINFVSCMKEGTGPDFVNAFESARLAWKTRTGKP